MLRTYFRVAVVVVISTVTFMGAMAFGAEVARYQLVPIKVGEATYTYMIDVEKGDVYEVKEHKTSKGNLEHYMKNVPQFDKEKEVLKWITEMEKTNTQ